MKDVTNGITCMMKTKIQMENLAVFRIANVMVSDSVSMDVVQDGPGRLEILVNLTIHA